MSRNGSTVVRAAAVAVLLVTVLAPHLAFAQAHNPFGVGISEGGGSASGITGWILQQQVVFERQLSAAVRATKQDGSAFWLLSGLSFVYGVFHAAGPGHGKAVMTSYLFANERALKRGLVLTLLAALLQGLVAILLVGILAVVLHATAQRMKDAATLIESLSYASVAVLGAWLVWQKGRGFIRALRDPPQDVVSGSSNSGSAPVRARQIAAADPCGCPPLMAYTATGSGAAAIGMTKPLPIFTAHRHDPNCGHYHAPDAATLGDGFSWRQAMLTVVAAGARPCSGAILVLVFSLAQGIFVAGVAATLAMSLGTAITTGAIAGIAVLAKDVAVRFAAPETRRGTLVIRGLETAAAALVLVAGLSLFLGYTAMGGA
ncbi:nickel/cobalt transporter [Lichenihabitans psoromatis]|uniref:nickel/cobalt transporter n=1 Tax=Lichenihabitans psoromatis TaxID=2528642 RepID=UPI001038388B|nr:nickel/cobalt transporter [Lichenihabitans psoromatis]